MYHVHDDDVDAIHELEEFQAGKSDGAGTDDEDGFTGLGVAALHGVVADGEGLDEGEFIVGKVVAGVDFMGGDDPVGFAESAVVMHADDLDTGAAVEVSFLRGGSGGVVDVGFERAFVAGFHMGDIFADGDDLQAEFVAGGAGVVEKGKLAEVAGKVGAADTHAVGADEGFVRPGVFGVGDLDGGDFFGGGEFDGVHVVVLLRGGAKFTLLFNFQDRFSGDEVGDDEFGLGFDGFSGGDLEGFSHDGAGEEGGIAGVV